MSEAPNPSGDTPRRRPRPTAAVRTRVARAQADLDALRARNRMVDVGFRTWERDTKVGGGVLASALAFRVFLFLVPFVFVTVTVVPVAADTSGTTTRELADRFGIAGLAGRAVRSASGLSPAARIWILVGALFALVLATRALLRVLRIVHGLAWHIPLDRITKPRAVRDGAVTIFGVAGILLLGALAAGLRDNLGVFGIVPISVDWAIVGILWFFVELYLPHDGGRWVDLVPGAVVVAVGAWGLQIITVVWYTHTLEHRSEAFGAIGVILTIMAWSYLLGRIVVTAANLNAALVDRRAASEAAPSGGRSAPARPGEHGGARDHEGDHHLEQTELQTGVPQDHQDPAGQDQRDQRGQQHPPHDARGLPES